MKNYKLSVQPYKGTKDYFPLDMAKRNYLFNIWRQTAIEFGYEEYDTPIIEDANIYRAKSGDELANTQLYNFVDKGGREVAIRPEMTPSVARLIAQKVNELPKPIRWFSIDKFYRYEKPQKGRSREFFQLNIDMFGIANITAETEIFQFINTVMEKIKAPKSSWKVYVNNRYLMDYLFEKILKLKAEQIPQVARAIDNFTKMEPNNFKDFLKDIGLDKLQIEKLMDFISMDLKGLYALKDQSKGAEELIKLFDLCEQLELTNFEFKPYIMRGIAYYTGTVIEMFDVGSSENPRALFGGGRYDDLLDIFDKPKIPAFGIGWGSVTMEDFMNTYKLFPDSTNITTTKVLITLVNKKDLVKNMELANYLRSEGINTENILEENDLRKQLSYGSKKKIPFVIFVEEDKYVVRDMTTGEQIEVAEKEDLIQHLTK
ncbi:MAG TPA: histidine--tRNA ligase [Candidatus Dojkabacteria bacterium]|nr:histidine--tRNA ligase [Candidatus Dojkabacteria bacterium]